MIGKEIMCLTKGIFGCTREGALLVTKNAHAGRPQGHQQSCTGGFDFSKVVVIGVVSIHG
jgi:hypothetical protein